MKKILANILLNALFYRSPKITINKEEEKLFNNLFEDSLKKSDKLIEYNLPIQKYKFLYYLSNNKPIVLHGSNNNLIDYFEPREQTLFNGKMAKAVFATKDPIWPVFYATLQKDKIVGNIRNAALSINSNTTFHYYSLTKSTMLNDPWTSGMVYILPADTFSYLGRGAIQFNEWISERPVSPIAKIEVHPSDFHFLNKISIHQTDESVIKSWFLYKFRTRSK